MGEEIKEIATSKTVRIVVVCITIIVSFYFINDSIKSIAGKNTNVKMITNNTADMKFDGNIKTEHDINFKQLENEKINSKKNKNEDNSTILMIIFYIIKNPYVLIIVILIMYLVLRNYNNKLNKLIDK